MSIAEELAKKYRFAVNHGFGNAIDEALELAAKRIEAKIGSLAVSRDRAREAGRHGVASCRQSDMETCERMAAEVRSLKSAAVQTIKDQER